MVLLQDGLIAFLSSVGLAAVVWFLAGAFLRAGRPAIPGLMLVLPLQGEALAMEADVRELRRFRHQLPGSRIVLADCGMTEDARALAEYLARRTAGACVMDGGKFGMGPPAPEEEAYGRTDHLRGDHT